MVVKRKARIDEDRDSDALERLGGEKGKRDISATMSKLVEGANDVEWEELPDLDIPPMAVEFVGEQGTGKTHCGLSFPEPALCDTEGKGWVVLKKFGNKRWFRARTFGDVLDFVNTVLNDDKIKTAVFDSSRDIVDMAERFVLKELGRDTLYSTKGAVMYSHVYGKMDWIIQTLRMAGKNVIFTSRLKDEYVNDSRTGNQITDGYKKARYQVDLVIRFTTRIRWNDETHIVIQPVGNVLKDGFIRRGKYTPYIEEATYDDICKNLMESIDDVDKYMTKFLKDLGLGD